LDSAKEAYFMFCKLRTNVFKGFVLLFAASIWLFSDGPGVHALAFEPAQEVVVKWVDLPKQGQITHELILRGGPFPYEKDGTVFGNRERILPRQARGYYREYTVPTPGAHNRGARRIVCGGKVPTQPVACYYTDDHYASFRRIVAAR
jgi:ribonuclease T1